MNSLRALLPWRLVFKVGKPFWYSEMRKVGLAHLGGIILLMSVNAAVAVFVNHTAGSFMTAVEAKSLADFWFYLCCSVGAIAVAAPVQVFYSYIRTRLALVWRSWLSGSLIESYGEVFEEINQRHDIDNAEQRVTQDAESFCNSAVGLFMSLVDAAINVLTFITVLWVIAPPLAFTVMVYSTMGLLVVSVIGKSLVGFNFQLMKNEADLRATLTQARTTTAGQEVDSEALTVKVKGKLADVVATLMDILKVNRNIQLFTNIFNALVSLIPVVIVAPSYFAGDIKFGTITQAVLAFGAVFNGATVIIGQFSGISSFAAITNRLGYLIEVMDQCRPARPQ
ncbi:hypothetical protein KBI23_08350 [bacterium]|nr:hypothetical protein [bacterium]